MVVGVNARLLISDQLEGIPRYIYEVVFNMALQHPETTFILYFDRKVRHSLKFPENIIFRVVPLMTRHPLLWHLWFDYFLPFYVKSDHVDVFYSGDGFLSKRMKIPQILVTHDLAYIHFPEHMITAHVNYSRKNIPIFHEIASGIIAVSESTKKDIITQFGIPESKVTVAGNAVDGVMEQNPCTVRPWITELSVTAKPYFFFVGALHPRKNIQNLCLGFLEFNKKHNHLYTLVLAGRLAWKSDSIKNLIDQSDNIIHTGVVTEDEKIVLYNGCEGLLYVSFFEGFGIPLLEAMKVGIPVLTSDCSSMPEVAGNAAILVNPDDIKEISEGITQLTKKEIRESLIKKGNTRINEFSWSKSAAITYEMLTKYVRKNQ